MVRGSMDAEYFLELFELILRDATAGKRIYDARAAPFRNDEWWMAEGRASSGAPAADVADAGGVCTAGGECAGDSCAR